jgi:hypothetical protein
VEQPTPPDSTNNSNKVDPLPLVDLLDKSYKEVLDATKHQDDKVGRFLTAFAFFAGGAIALLNQDFVKNTSYQIDPFPKLRLPSLLLGFFLVLLGFTVLALLMSVGTPLKLPGFGIGSGSSSSTSSSPIYFLAISKITSEEWKAQLTGMTDDARARWLQDSLISGGSGHFRVCSRYVYACDSDSDSGVLAKWRSYNLRVGFSCEVACRSDVRFTCGNHWLRPLSRR